MKTICFIETDEDGNVERPEDLEEARELFDIVVLDAQVALGMLDNPPEPTEALKEILQADKAESLESVTIKASRRPTRKEK